MHFVPYPEPGTVRPGATRASVAAVILDGDGRVLLHQRADNGHWGIPGGSIELGESVTAAAVREVREETGHIVEVRRIVGVYSDPGLHQVVCYPDGNVVHYVTVVLECAVVGGEPTLCDETLALAWCAPDDLPEPFVPSHRIRLADALARRETAFLR